MFEDRGLTHSSREYYYSGQEFSRYDSNFEGEKWEMGVNRL
jgi:hypothetical protein